jgi:hypothetical protein
MLRNHIHESRAKKACGVQCASTKILTAMRNRIEVRSMEFRALGRNVICRPRNCKYRTKIQLSAGISCESAIAGFQYRLKEEMQIVSR